MKKKILSLLALSLAFSCNAPNNIDNTLNNKSVNSYIQQNGNEVVIDVSQGKFKGADLTLNIKDLNKMFSVKKSQQGTVNLFGSVKSYMVYLIKNSASTYPTDGSGDPLSDKVLGPYVFNVDNNVYPAVKFTNVPPSGNDYYYFAVRAFDGVNATGTELVKPDNGNINSWSGVSSGMPIAVSDGSGVRVSDNYVVSPLLPPVVNINTTISPTQAAVLDAHVKFLNTSSTSVSAYAVNFCTDPKNPSDTAVLDTPFMIPKGMSFTDDVIQLTNLPRGTYYLTVSKANSENPNEPNLIDDVSNFSPAVTYDDTSNNLVVSSNSVTIDNNQKYEFSDGADWFKISVPLVSEVIYPIISIPTINFTPVQQPGIAVDKDGNTYVSDVSNNKIIKMFADGSVDSSFITGVATYNITTDNQGNLYIANQSSADVRKYDSNGNLLLTISNRPTSAVPLVDPTGVAVDGNGNIYVSDVIDTGTGVSQVFKYSSSGVGISVIAGDPTGASPEGDLGVVLSSNETLKWVLDIDVSSSGEKVYICEGGYSLIKQVDFPSSRISTIAGGGLTTPPARSLNLLNPSGIELDSLGNLYISDKSNNRVIKVDLISSNYSVVAGENSQVPTTSLPLIKSTNSALNSPFGLELDKVGNIYITDNDSSNVRILKVVK